MKKYGKIVLLLTIIMLCIIFNVYSKELGPVDGKWKTYDKVLAVVNDYPIMDSEVDRRYEIKKKKHELKTSNVAKARSKILDEFIEKSIIMQTAEEESIIVSDTKINNEVQKIMERMGINSLDDFKKYVVRREKMTFKEYQDELRHNIMMQQLMTFVIEFSPPSEAQAKDFYRKNKQKLLQVNVQHILIRPKGKSFAAEKAANKQISEIRSRALKGESFAALARNYSEDPGSRGKGGSLGWVILGELDPYFAQAVFQMQKKGQISGVIKSSFGYHIVKYHGRRYAPFHEVESLIYNIISRQGRYEQFQRWVQNKRRQSDVKIYMKGYTQS